MSTPPTTTESASSTPGSARFPSIWRAGLRTAAVAAAGSTAVYLLGLLTPASWEVSQRGETLPVLVVLPALASIAAVLAGTVLLWLLRRFRWGVTAWTVVAVLVGVGSVGQPLQAATDPWTGALLALMHLVCLAAALVWLRPAGRRVA